MTATVLQDQDQEIAALRDQIETLRPKVEEAKREAEEARAALVDGLETPTKAANAQGRFNALQGAYDDVAARLNELETGKRRAAGERLAEAVRQKQLEKLAAAARAASETFNRGVAAYERIIAVIEKEVETIAQVRIELQEHLRARDALSRTVDVREGELDGVHLGHYDMQIEPPDFRSHERLREAVRPMVAQAESRLRRAAARG